MVVLLTLVHDQEVTMTHVADDGLTLKNAGTGNAGFTFNLVTGDTAITVNNVLGAINFAAPDEASGTDAILNGARIIAISEGTFAADNNATTLDFRLGVSGAPSEAFKMTSGGDFKLVQDAAVLGFGADNDVTLTHVADTGLLLNSTMALQFNDSSQFINAPSATVLDINATDEIELNATLVDVNANVEISGTAAIVGVTTFTATPVFSADVTIEDDLFLDSDAAVIHLGEDGDVTLTHVHDTGILLNSTMAIQFNDASQFINAPSNAILDINATDEIELNATLLDVNANINASGTYTGAGLMTTGGNIVIPNAGTIGSASDTDAISISSGGVVAVTATTASTSATSGALTVAGGAGVAADLSVGDDLRLISDAAVLSFGADNEVTLTHVHNDGLLLNADMQLQFRDSAINIRSDADGDLDINADDEIELNSTLMLMVILMFLEQL